MDVPEVWNVSCHGGPTPQVTGCRAPLAPHDRFCDVPSKSRFVGLREYDSCVVSVLAGSRSPRKIVLSYLYLVPIRGRPRASTCSAPTSRSGSARRMGCSASSARTRRRALGPHHPRQKQEGTGSVRFVSVLDFSKIHRFGSVRFGSVRFGSVRFGKTNSRFDASACVFRTCRGSVRFGSVRFRVWFRPVPEFNSLIRLDSVRPVRFGFLYSFLPKWLLGLRRARLKRSGVAPA